MKDLLEENKHALVQMKELGQAIYDENTIIAKHIKKRDNAMRSFRELSRYYPTARKAYYGL